MEQFFSSISGTYTIMAAVSGLVAIGFGVYWLFNKGAKQRHIAQLREQLDTMRPTDPEYNKVKLLLAAMIADSNMASAFDYSGDSSDSGQGLMIADPIAVDRTIKATGVLASS